MNNRVSGGRIGLMITAFLLPILIGVFATYAVQVPGARGAIAEARLARALGRDDAARRAAMAGAAPLLESKARAELAALPPDAAGAARAMELVAASTLDAGRVIAYRLRLMTIVIGVLGAGFGVALLGIREAG